MIRNNLYLIFGRQEFLVKKNYNITCLPLEIHAQHAVELYKSQHFQIQ